MRVKKKCMVTLASRILLPASIREFAAILALLHRLPSFSSNIVRLWFLIAIPEIGIEFRGNRIILQSPLSLVFILTQ